MADKQLRYVLTGTDQSASKTISGTSEKAEKAGKKISETFSKLGQAVGGEVGEIADKAGELFEGLGEAGGKKLSQKLAIGGTAIAGIGAALVAMGDKDKAAEQQLETAVENAGGNWEELEGKIKSADKQLAKYGDTTAQTDDALTTLTNATKSPEKALDNLGVAADLAAAKHIRLNDAAVLVGKGITGSSTRIFTEYGIQIKKNTDGTSDYAGAMEQLAHTLHGQADAQADTFTGKLKALRTEVENGVAEFGAKYGPSITAAGVAMVALAPIMKTAAAGAKKIGSAFRTTGAEAELGAAAVAEADGEIVAANESAAASSEELSAAGGRSKLAMAGAAAGVAAVGAAALAGGYELAKFLDKNSAAAYVMNNFGKSVDSLTTAVVNNGGSIKDVGDEWTRAQLQSSGLAEKAAKSGITIDQMTKAIEGGRDSTADLIKEWEAAGKPSDSTIIKLGSITTAYANVRKNTEKLTEAQKTETKVVKDQTTVYGVAESAVKTVTDGIAKQKQATAASTLQMRLANDAAGLLSQAFDTLNGKTLGAKSAELSFKDSVSSVTDAVKNNGRSLSDNTAKGRANQEAIISSIQAAQAHAQAVGKQTGSTIKATAAYDKDIAALKSHAEKAGLDKGEIDNLVKSIGKMPKVKTTTVDVNYSEVQAAIRNVKALSQSISNLPVATQIKVGHRDLSFHASGTILSSPTLVSPNGDVAGEAGSEAIVPLDRPLSQVDPSVRGLSAFAQGKLGVRTQAGPVFNITFPSPVVGYDAATVRQIVGMFEQWTRGGGRINIAKAIA